MRYFLYLLLFLTGLFTTAEAQQFSGLDKSPMDVAYLPDNFAHDRDPGQKAIVKVFYSRPQKKERDLFGSKVPYGKVWRTGANESPELKVYQDITIGGKALKAGTYSIFTIPNEKEWTILISSDLDYWGAFKYNEKNDVLSFKVPSKIFPEVIEAFSIKFEDQGNNTAVMRMGWDTTMVEVPLKY